mgnify:CR=1 FL=1
MAMAKRKSPRAFGLGLWILEGERGYPYQSGPRLCYPRGWRLAAGAVRLIAARCTRRAFYSVPAGLSMAVAFCARS